MRAPEVPWPRSGSGRLVVADRVSRLDELALMTVVPDRVVRADEGIAHDGPVCPVAVRYRTEDGGDPTWLLAGDDLRTTIRRARALQGLVIEVHLLPPRNRTQRTTRSAVPAGTMSG